MNHALILNCILENVGLFRERQDLEQLTTLQSSREPPTKCWEAVIYKWCSRSCWVGPQKALCSGCVGKREYPGSNRMSGRKTLHCLHWCNVNSLRGNVRFFYLGSLDMKPLLHALAPVQCVWKSDLMENADYCFKILYWRCYLYFNLVLNCFLQTVFLPICALLCQRTDFPTKRFSADRYY